MKKLSIIILGLVVIGLISTPAAHAGAARRHTIEGFMLGTGAAILGTIIYNEMTGGPEKAVWKSRHKRKHESFHRCRKPQRHHRGHWEMEKIWVEPVYETKWNPGHYNRRGKWIPGRHEKFIVERGYWLDKRVWVWH